MSRVTKAKGQQPGQGKESNAPKPATRAQTGPSASSSTSAPAKPQQEPEQSGKGKESDTPQGTGVQTNTPGTTTAENQPQLQPEGQTHEQTERELNLEIAQACIDIVESFRRTGGCKPAVIAALVQKLGVRGSSTDNPTAVAALDSYCAQVDEVDNTRKEAEARQRAKESEQESDAERGQSKTLGQSKGKKRADRSPTCSQSSQRSLSRSVSPFALSEDEQSAKRKKPDPAQFAWANSNTHAEKGLRPELQKTLALLRIYSMDIKYAKSNLINSVGAPEFPDAEWNNILRGKPVDLDNVFCGQYSLQQDEKHVEKLGLVELSYRPVVPSKVVKSSGDWVIAWQHTSAALLYAFPHRKDELDGYYAHVFSLFGAILDEHHNRILDYDRTVRKRVAAKRTVLLTDTHLFHDLRTQ